MNKHKLNMIEVLLISLIGVITVIFQPPIPLLAIPFVTIMGMRQVFSILEGSEKEGKN